MERVGKVCNDIDGHRQQLVAATMRPIESTLTTSVKFHYVPRVARASQGCNI